MKAAVTAFCLLLVLLSTQLCYATIEFDSGLSEPIFSPDGRKIVFFSNVFSDRPSICCVNADGSNMVRLRDTGRRAWSLAWSPDGNHIAYYDQDMINGVIYIDCVENCYVTVIDTAGGDKRVIRSVKDNDIKPLSWLKDGSGLVVQRKTGGSTILRLAKGKGNQSSFIPPTRTHLVDGCHDSSLSPDGEMVAFTGPSPTGSLWIANRDGSGRRRLSIIGDASQPSWSSDSKTIVFVNSWKGEDTRFDFDGWLYYTDVAVVGADGKGYRRVTNLTPELVRREAGLVGVWLQMYPRRLLVVCLLLSLIIAVGVYRVAGRRRNEVG